MSDPQTSPLTVQISGVNHKQRVTALHQPIDANGNPLAIGDRVKGAWQAGKDYIDVIEGFTGRTRIKAYGQWISGRRSGDSDRFTIATESLLRINPITLIWDRNRPSWNDSPEGQNFWERVSLVWDWVSEPERKISYFDRTLDYPRSLKFLQLIESRRQTRLPIDNNYPPEQTCTDTDSEVKRLRRLGVAKPGAWIEVEAVKGRNFRQAKWVSETACFQSKRVKGSKCKTQYIGKEDSPKHKRAIAMVQRRNQIKSLLRLNHE
jgi:hypothetical protein